MACRLRNCGWHVISFWYEWGITMHVVCEGREHASWHGAADSCAGKIDGSVCAGASICSLIVLRASCCVSVAETVQRCKVGVANFVGMQTDLHGEVEHGFLARDDVGLWW